MAECENITVLPKKNNYPLMPINYGEEKCRPRHSWGAGVRSTYIIHFVISGKGKFYCGTEKYTLGAGQMFVIYPGTIVKYVADATEPWRYAWVTFTGDEAKELFSKIGISLQNPTARVEKMEDVLRLIRSMPSERSADLQSNVAFSIKLYELFFILLSSAETNVGGENEYLTTAIHYIKAHYNENITVEGIAARIGISRKYLFAIFKRTLKVSPKEYLLNYRIKKACEFLADKQLSVASIAYSVGYDDPLNFSKIFKLKTGLSPSEWRKRLN